MAIVIDYDIHGQPVEGKGLTILIDYAGGPGDQPTYVGYAVAGTATSEAAWKIFHCTYVGDNLVAKEWPVWVGEEGLPPPTKGDTQFRHIWDDRASLTYN